MLPLLLLAAFCVGGTTGFVSSSTPGSVRQLPELLAHVRSGGGSGLELVRQLLRELHECRTGKAPAMHKVILANKTVTCNDGSPSGYYIRESKGSKRWIVFLEGGWYCFDVRSCHQRWTRSRHLMSSTLWPDTRSVGGILSPDAEENPYWYDANQVFIPYCSSDTWSGAAYATKKGEFSFLGSLIVMEVIKDLLNKGLMSADMLLLAGSSAGGTGVLINLDRVSDLLRGLRSRVEVRGLSDSGWFLDNEPFRKQDCSQDPQTCAPVEAIKKGVKLWKGQVPVRCQMQYAVSDLWRCYFGYRIYSNLQTPVFVFQWLFDEAQMFADNVGAPVSKPQWDYIHKMGNDLRTSLENVTAVFAPSCISHMVLTKKDWRQVKINKVSLPQALRCWELQAHEHNHHHHHPHHHLFDPLSPDFVSRDESSVVGGNDAPIASLRVARKKSDNNSTENRNDQNSSESSPAKEERRKQRRKERKRRRQNRNKKRKKNSRKEYLRVRHRWTLHEDLCYHWLVDECSWPQCNRACPRLHDPFTGEELDFIELLKSFGLDMASVASALGIDMVTLNDMDHDTLLQMLTQQTN